MNKEHHSYEDRRAYADHSDPVNKLTPEERQKVIDTVNEARFASMPYSGHGKPGQARGTYSNKVFQLLLTTTLTISGTRYNEISMTEVHSSEIWN